MNLLPAVFTSIIPLMLVAVSIYSLLLFIMVANRCIKALDIYIDEKTKRKL